MAERKFSDLSKISEVNKNDIFAIERTDGTKQASFEQLCNAIAVQKIEELVEELPVIEENDTLNEIVGKINKWQKDALLKFGGSSGGGSSVDVLDSKEEIEANTESGKAAGALAVQEMFSEINSNLGGLSFYEDEDGNKYVVGADSVPKKLGENVKKYLIKDGVIQDGIQFTRFSVGGNGSQSAQSGKIAQSGNNFFYVTMDVSNYSTLKGIYDTGTTSGAAPVATNSNAVVVTSGLSNVAADLSNLNGNVKVGFYTYASTSQYAYIYDLWLE